MLVSAAVKAGISVPKDPSKFEAEEFPHWSVFCSMQLGKPVKYHGEHWDNARVIAAISNEDIKVTTHTDLAALGCSL